MAGRGRGGRATSTLTQEQLQALGCVGKDMPNGATGPPALFPTLPSKPVALESGPDRDFKILWKEDFISYLRESPYFTASPKNMNKDTKVQRYTDRIVNVLSNDQKTNVKGDFMWETMPKELQPNYKRSKKDETGVALKKAKTVQDVEQKLKLLEQKEKTTQNTGNAKDGTKSDDDDEEIDEENIDDEMDDENDYGGNYFDNGEAYNEEDDNLDDGPVY